MAIRVKQIIFDDDLNIQGFNLTGLGRFVFGTAAAGTNPNATEILYADGKFKVNTLLVRHQLQVGESNTDFMIQKALGVELDTRNLVYAYDSSNRVNQITEKDGSSPVKVTTLTYDSANRIVTKTDTTTAGTQTSTYTYTGSTIDFASVTRAVS